MARAVALELFSDGIALKGGAYVPDGDIAGTVLLLHGIPSVRPPEPGDRGYPGLAQRFAEDGYLTGWIDLRAVRESKGYFSITGWVDDARVGLDALLELDEARGSKVAVVGSSAGGAVATEMTRRGAPVDALILLAAPARWVSFADDATAAVTRITREAGMALAPEVLADPEAWADGFSEVQTIDAISEIDVPVLVVHGSADDVVPVSHAREIANRGRRAEQVIVDGGGHQLRKDERALAAVFAWLESTL